MSEPSAARDPKRPRNRLPRFLSPALVRVVPTAALVAAAWAMAWREHGSIAAQDWLAYAVLAALALATILFSSQAVHPGREALIGLAFLVALAFWAGLSLTWSPVPSLARDEGLLTLFYATAFAVPVLTLRTPSDRLAGTAVLVIGMAGLAIVTAFELIVSDRKLELFDEGRLSFPIDYANAQAGIFLVAFWPAIILAARRRTHPLLRALGCGAATALLGGWLLAQSKGGVIALVVSTIVFFAICPARLRVLVPTLVAAGLVAAGSAPLTEPFRADGDAAVRSAIHNAGVTLLALTAVAVAIGLLYARLDLRIEVSRGAQRFLGRLSLAGLAAGIAAGVIAFFLAVDQPGGFFERQWHSFKRLPSNERTSTHLLSLGSNRYDFWRVSLNEFREHPIAGSGARAFGPVYLQKRESPETPARAHSLPIEMLFEEGLIGLALLCGAVGFPLALAARRARRRRVPAAAAFAGGAYWLVHASGDWIWTFPAVAVPFFVLIGIGASPDDAPLLRRRNVRPAAIASVVLALLVFAPPWVSAKLTSQALSEPPDAARDLRWARRLDPISVEPFIARATLARTAAAKIPPLEEAVDQEPKSAALQYLLGTAYLDAGRREDALLALRIARRLDPRDPFIEEAFERARR
ncbi:MAG: O-antigen ligase family protein [Gaiellaceae bacterium]